MIGKIGKKIGHFLFLGGLCYKLLFGVNIAFDLESSTDKRGRGTNACYKSYSSLSQKSGFLERVKSVISRVRLELFVNEHSAFSCNFEFNIISLLFENNIFIFTKYFQKVHTLTHFQKVFLRLRSSINKKKIWLSLTDSSLFAMRK